jgi:hypothetical protein
MLLGFGMTPYHGQWPSVEYHSGSMAGIIVISKISVVYRELSLEPSEKYQSIIDDYSLYQELINIYEVSYGGHANDR